MTTDWAAYWGGKTAAIYEVWKDFEQLGWWHSADPLIVAELDALERAMRGFAIEAWREADNVTG